MLPHLNGLSGGEDPTWWPRLTQEQRGSVKTVDKHLTHISENIVCPPPLFYSSQKPSEIYQKEEKYQQTEEIKENAFPGCSADTVTEIKNKDISKTFIQMRSLEEHKNEGTQTTNEQHSKPFVLPQNLKRSSYPIIQGLIAEVVSLGLNVENLQGYISSSATQHRPQTSTVKEVKPFKQQVAARPLLQKQSSVKFAASSVTNETKPTPKVSSASTRKSRPLAFGMTKSLRLRMEMNRQQKEQQEQKQSTLRQKKELRPKRKARTPPEKHYSYVEMYKDMLTSPSFNTTSPTPSHHSPVLHVKDLLPIPTVSGSFAQHSLTSLQQNDGDKSGGGGDVSPLVHSRQSIEIHLPNATSIEYDNDDGRSEGKTSSKFSSSGLSNEEEEEEESLSEKISRQMSIRYASSLMSSDASSTRSESSMSRHLTNSSPHTSSPPAASIDKSAFDTLTGKSEDESVASSVKNADDDDELDFFGRLNKQLCAAPAAMLHSTTLEDSLEGGGGGVGRKAFLQASALPVPEPSDSPVMRSLASIDSKSAAAARASDNSKPSYPQPPPKLASQRSSVETRHGRRRSFIKKSAETSFYLSSDFDVRSSDLADMKTPDMSELMTSDDEARGGGETTTTNLKKKMSFSTLTSLSEIQ